MQNLMNILILAAAFMVSSRALGSNMINGAGATFPEPIYTKWFSEYSKKNPDVTINYQGIGSGGGIRQLIAGTVDFGASDSPMTEEELKKAAKTVVHVPTVLGAVVVSYNLKLDKPLKLNGPVVADIFSGKIKKWSDPAIAALNPGLKIPDTTIIVATRSDGSGTTAVFTDYLSKVSADWKGKAGKTVDWFKGSLGAKGNAGVAGFIKQAEGTVGYIELVYALENKLAFAHIQNKKGKFVEANLKSVSASIPKKLVPDIAKNDFKASITDSDQAEAYPISGLTWILAFDPMDKAKGKPVQDMLTWTMGEEAQKMAESLHFAPVPKELREKVLARVKSIQLK